MTRRDKTSRKEKETHGLRVALQPLQALLQRSVHGAGHPPPAAPHPDRGPGVVDHGEDQAEKEKSKEMEGKNIKDKDSEKAEETYLTAKRMPVSRIQRSARDTRADSPWRQPSPHPPTS